MKVNKIIKDKDTPDERTIWRNENNQLHREDGPAIIWKDGTEYWYLNGEYHREDGPAVIFNNGKKRWFLNDLEYYTEDEYRKEMFRRNLKTLNNSI